MLFVTSQEGFEPPTDGLEGRCSILLSYWDKLKLPFQAQQKYFSMYQKRKQALFAQITLMLLLMVNIEESYLLNAISTPRFT